MADDDAIVFADDDIGPAPERLAPWKVAVIDDDEAVHEGTRFALNDFALNGRGLELLSAHTVAEGQALLRRHHDIAVVLLDVVMETESAGLDLVSFIRQELNNDRVRIILRTGQPGQAPERRIIVDYDINDYKAKTELTAAKLFTAMTAALRAYAQIERMSEMRRGLSIIVDAAATLFDARSMQRLSEGVLTQIASLLAIDCAGILVARERDHNGAFSILAGSGIYRALGGLGQGHALEPALRRSIEQGFADARHDFAAPRARLFFRTGGGTEIVVLLEAGRALSDTDRHLIEVFCARLSIAFDNVALYNQLQAANTELEHRVARRTQELTSVNRRLEAQWSRARRASAFQNEILGTVAHDLKSPLGVILGRAEIVGELVGLDPPPREKVAQQLGHVRDTVRRLTGMVDRLVADVTADALDIAIRRERAEVARLLGEVVDANRPLAEAKTQTLMLEAPPNLAIDCDYDWMREALYNLVNNAIKFSPPGAPIAVAAQRRGDHILIRVVDKGPGLLPEDRSRLFVRFQRLSAKPTGGEASTGLGLSIAKRIIDLHGGGVVAESAGAGHGTTFIITLPASPLPEFA